MDIRLTVTSPVPFRVLERRADGRGGVVEVPIAPESPFVDFSRTAGGGDTGSVTLQDLREMASNFPQYPGPITVGSGTHLRDAAGPAAGFFEAVELRGSTLWARLDLGPRLFRELVDERAWRGFSIEASRNLKKATAAFDGWVLTGGIFVNSTGLDVHFKLPDSVAASSGYAAVALSGIESSANAGVVPDQKTSSPASQGEETGMADEKVISLATHESRLADVSGAMAVANEKVTTLQASNRTLSEELARTKKLMDETAAALATSDTELGAQKALAGQKDAQLASVRKQLEAANTKLTENELKLRDAETRSLAIDVRDVVDKAIAAGVPPAVFDGFEADPASWMNANYASLDAFKASVARVQGVVKLSGSKPASSGSDPNADDSEDTVKLSPEDQAVIDRLNLGAVDYTGVTTEAEARKRLKAARAAKG